MAWSTPLTAVANAALTAAQFNASVRDNLLATAPALATTAGSIFVATGANAIAERIPKAALLNTSETTSSTSYTDLTSVGPQVTLTTGTNALVIVGAQLTNNTATSGSFMSYAVSGATTVPGTDTSALVNYPATANMPIQASRSQMQGLASGSNTIKTVYKAAAGTGAFSQRTIQVIPF